MSESQEKMWRSDRFIYRMADGSFQAQDEELPKPALAVELVVRAGEEIPARIAARHGWNGPR